MIEVNNYFIIGQFRSLAESNNNINPSQVSQEKPKLSNVSFAMLYNV